MRPSLPSESYDKNETEVIEPHEVEESQKHDLTSLNTSQLPTEHVIAENRNPRLIVDMLDDSIEVVPTSQRKLKEDLMRPTLLFDNEN